MRNFISNADLKLLQFLLADERVLVRRVVNENAPEYEPNGSKNAEQVEGGRPSVCREKERNSEERKNAISNDVKQTRPFNLALPLVYIH